MNVKSKVKYTHIAGFNRWSGFYYYDNVHSELQELQDVLLTV